MHAVQHTSPAALTTTGWSSPAAAAAQQVWVDPATGGSVDSMGNPVHLAGPGTPWVSPATAWMPTPAAQAGQGAAEVGSSSMLDAIANALLGIPTTASGAVAPSPAAAVPPGAAVAATFGAATAAPAQTVQTLALKARAATANTAAAAARGFATATGHAATAVTGARRVGSEVWAGVRNPRAIHVSQVPSKYNPTPAASNQDCGPVSVVMSLKLLGLSIPGIAQGAAPQRLVNRVRQLSGNVANTASTTNHQLERALTAAGARVREIADFGSIRAAVLAGKPVILNGNPGNRGAYGARFSAAQMTPFNGAHWILVSGYDSRSGKFIINDPLSKVGPVKVSPTQLEAYRAGSMGIEVAR